jgi:hypothetical protein
VIFEPRFTRTPDEPAEAPYEIADPSDMAIKLRCERSAYMPRQQPTKPQAVCLLSSAYDRGMTHDADDLLWEAFVTAALAVGPAEERRSRYGDKPALFTASREIAHLEAPGVIDLRITRAGWSRIREDFGDDPAVRWDPSRHDWIELHLRSAADLDRLGRLLTVAMAANALLVNSRR